MKPLFTIALILSLQPAFAQFVVGTAGLTVKSGVMFSVDGLTLTPSADLAISDNTLSKSATAIPGSPTGSISRVYHFENPVHFEGVVSISYITSELNGNTENGLQISHSSDEKKGYTVLKSSTVDLITHRVTKTVTNPDLLVATATSSESALPVTLIDFIATAEGQAALLKWSTASETNAQRFEIQHSPDVKTWQAVGDVNATGESSEKVSYQFTHAGVTDGANYYRLKMIDSDGTYAHSAVRSVVFKLPDATIVFPNPAHEVVQLRNSSTQKINLIRIYDLSGQLHKENAGFPEKGIEVGKLAAGSYILEITRENGRVSNHSFFKK